MDSSGDDDEKVGGDGDWLLEVVVDEFLFSSSLPSDFFGAGELRSFLSLALLVFVPLIIF
jgi:hypothetical protein